MRDVSYVPVSELKLNRYRVTIDGVPLGPVYSRYVAMRYARWLRLSLAELEPLLKKRHKKETTP